jgi:hypothetical protein
MVYNMGTHRSAEAHGVIGMFGFGPFLVSRLWRGVEWEHFWLLLMLYICYMAWTLNHAFNTVPNNVIPEAAAAAPVNAVDSFMRRYEDEGYLLYHTRDLDPDAREHNRLIIEYVVMTRDRQQSWTFKWAWEVPRELTIDWGRIDGKLVPLSQWARESHEDLESYIASGGN